MKQLFLLLVFCCFNIRAFAQDEIAPVQTKTEQPQDSIKKQSRLFVGAGVAFPTGEFKSHSYGPQDILWAERGTYVLVGYIRELHNNFSIGATLNSIVHKVNTKGYQDTYNNNYYHGLSRMPEVSSDAWQTTAMLADIYIQLPVNKFTLYTRGSIGFSYTVHPEQYRTYQYFSYEGEVIAERDVKTEKATALAPAYGLAGGIHYTLGRFGMGLEVGFQFTKPGYYLKHSGDYYSPAIKEFKTEQEMMPTLAAIQLSYCLN